MPDRKTLLEILGGPDAVNQMSAEAKADALETLLQGELNHSIAAGTGAGPASGAPDAKRHFPTAAEVEALIETRHHRLGVGNLFYAGQQRVRKLPPMPEKPTLADFFRLRFHQTAHHVLQSANLAQKNGLPEEVVLACLLHDLSQELIHVDHGWWSAHIFEPYVSERTAFAIRYHQALRFYPDEAAGYHYPELYLELFGEDYKPEPYVEAAYQMVRKHKWYDLPRMVTVNDLYSFEPGVVVSLEQFTDVLGRNFKQPREGLGFDNSPVAHIWRSLIWPDHPL